MSGDVNSTTVMIVEDEMIISLVTRSYLEQLGYRVVSEVRSGEEAVEVAQELQPDLIIMDVQLAGAMDGVEAANLITSSISTRIIFVSAFERPDRPLPNGSLYLDKPLSKKALRDSLETFG